MCILIVDRSGVKAYGEFHVAFSASDFRSMNAPPCFKTEACYLNTEGLVAAVVVGMLEWGSREPYEGRR